MADLPETVVIIGGGQAGAQAAMSLRQGGFAGPITMVCDEAVPPYQRPPLSKAYLAGTMGLDRLMFRDGDAWAAESVTLKLNCSVASIDRAAKSVTLTDGETLSYGALIIATGSRVRNITCPGADLKGVHYLRTVRDVGTLQADFAEGKRLVVVGCGYIGLEVAAVAIKQGLHVTALEAADRVLARVTSAEISNFYQDVHRAAGVDLRVSVKVEGCEGEGSVTGVRLADGTLIPADLILVGVGILPNQELAAEAGIICTNGIVVDDNARTSDPSVFAIGDCAFRPLALYDRTGRLESVHNAIEQGKLAVAAILGLPAPALDTPWFWSDQYDLKLQTAGLFNGATKVVIRGSIEDRKFAAFHLDADNRILAVDAINAAPEFLAGKQIIGRKGRVAPEVLADTSVSMKQIAAQTA